MARIKWIPGRIMAATAALCFACLTGCGGDGVSPASSESTATDEFAYQSPPTSSSPPVETTAPIDTGMNFGTASLTWLPPTAHTDGTTIVNLAGYNIYYGNSTTAMTNRIQITNPGLTAYTVANLASGTYYFGITAYTAAGSESDLSAVGSKTIM